MYKKLKEQKAITLVALVITIVILLILAGISIQAITNTGLFENAKKAAEESKYANAEEKVKMAVMASYDENASLNKNLLKDSLNKIDGINPQVTEVEWDLKVNVDGYEFTITEYGTVTCVGRKEQEKLPENNKDNPQDAGKEVALKAGWGEETTAVVKTSDGTEVTGLTKVSTVYAVSVGNGETVPVPKGFFYVGGKIDTGVIISDNEADKYDGKTDKTTHEYATKLKGNQFAPPEYVGAIMDLCQNRRGEFKDMQYLDPTRVELHYSMPLNEIIYDFFDALKSRTRGYGSLDYELEGYRPSKLVKLDILLNGEIVDALSFILFADNAYARARKICEKLKDNIPRQMFEIPVQAAVGGKIIARETIKALRKDVLAKCYGGDITRKKKLLEKQKEGKKRMRTFGTVAVPSEAFMAVLKLDDES